MIQVGAATETEMKDTKLRIEDALSATRAAVEEGIIPGGGTALLKASDVIAKVTADLTGDEKTGAAIVLRALEEPVRQIAANAGLEGSIIVEKIKENASVTFGFNAATDEYVDMIDAGIVDPTKVTRSALQNAASVASLLLTTESIVTDIPSKEPPVAPAPAGGMPGMY